MTPKLFRALICFLPTTLILFLLTVWLYTADPFQDFLQSCALGKLSDSQLVSKLEWIESRDSNGMTCLILASKNNHVEVVRSLLAHGAKPNQENAPHHALRGAALFGHYEVCMLLLESGALVNAKSLQGKTALMGAVMKGHKKVAKLLLQWGSDCTLVNDFGETAKDLGEVQCP